MGASMPQPGARIDDRYRVVRILGEGGMALVYEVVDERSGQRLALKMLVPELARDEEIVARFEREAAASALLRSPHVVRVMSLEDGSLHPYMLMELLEGRDLEGELEARQCLPADEAVDYVLQACAALSEAHAAGIVHRDLKPANLFLEAKAPPTIKVLDFGISKVLGAPTKLTKVGAIIGTVLYMAPEQVRGDSDVDARADIWAMGVILYELIAGDTPWRGNTQQVAGGILSSDPPMLTQVPAGLWPLIRAMLQRDRNMRPSTFEEVARALAPYARLGLGTAFAGSLAAESARLKRRETVRMAAAPPTPLTREPLRKRSHWPLVLGIVVAGMGLSGVVLIVIWFLRYSATQLR